MDQTLVLAARYFSRTLAPFNKALAGGDDQLIAFLGQLGWTLPEAPQALKDLQTSANQLTASLARLEAALRLAGDNVDAEDRLNEPAAEFLLDLALFTAAIRGLPDGLRAQLPQEFITTTHIDEEFLRRLVHHALLRQVEYESRDLYHITCLLGLVEAIHHDADPLRFQPAFVERRFRTDRLLRFGQDPAGVMREVYGWGTGELHSAKLLLALRDLSFLLLSPAFFDYAPRVLLRAIEPILPDTVPPTRGLRMPLFASSLLELSLGLYPLPSSASNAAQGFVVTVAGLAAIEETFALSPSISLHLKNQSDLAAGLALAFWPDRPPRLLGNLNTMPSALVEGANAALAVRYALPENSERRPLLRITGLQVDMKEISIEVGFAVGAESAVQAHAQVSLPGLRLRLDGLQQDSFLAQLLPDELALELDLSVGWSMAQGLYWQNNAGTKITIPLGRRIGPVAIDSLDLAVSSGDETFQLLLGVSASSQLGPVFVRVETAGIALSMNTQGGDFGLFDLGFSAAPPRRIGLVIDAPGVYGGGYLALDHEKGQYAGVLELQIAETIAVKAIGMLVTRLPGGVKGYSLLVIITAEDFKPIPLPLGFRLTGIGGLLAINRTFDEEALRAGLRSHTLDSVLFPEDPIRNAPQILSNLNRVFPAANGHHLFGPVVQIAWGTPALITADIGVVLEIGVRLRLLLLAQIVAILPRRENDLVRLQMDAVGVLDFDQGSAALDAVLYDSRLLKKFVLTGEMALRLKWEGAPNFALAIGGMHPAFNPPANFPKLERIAINLSAGENPRLRCEAYFALTANTVQFGARAELYAAAAGFSIHGVTGFDVLIQIDPFQFLAEFYAQLQLKRGSTNLFKVRVEGALAGPRPLHIKAKATFEILWWDVTIRVDKTLVGGEKPPPPEAIDVLPRLKEALMSSGNWSAQLPEGQRPMVTLRGNPATSEVLLHPLGTLTVKQNIVPLDLDITRFGQAAPAGARRFTISGVNLGGEGQATEPVRDFFAPAQFFEMSDEEKLSRPSFESMGAGVRIGSAEFVSSADSEDWLEVDAIEYETIIVDKEKKESRHSADDDRYQLNAIRLGVQAQFGAAGVSELRRSGRAKYRTVVGKHRLIKEGWSIVATDNLTVESLAGMEEGRPTNYSQAAEALGRLKRENPARAAGLKILRLSELGS